MLSQKRCVALIVFAVAAAAIVVVAVAYTCFVVYFAFHCSRYSVISPSFFALAVLLSLACALTFCCSVVDVAVANTI